jgi:acid phosphatase type 7
LIAPYLQLGSTSGPGKLNLQWAPSKPGCRYQVLWRQTGSTKWSAKLAPTVSPVSYEASTIEMNSVNLTGLPPGKPIEYRVCDSTNSLFQATTQLPTSNGNYTFAVFGDCAWKGEAERSVARKVHDDGIDYAVVTGDIVYPHGRISEYLSHFFPVYNAEKNTAEGVPLLRSTLFVSAPGNHDLYNGSFGVAGDLNKFGDGLGYFFFWNQPLNGPRFSADDKGITPIIADSRRYREFLKSAGDHFPNMSTFSFDYGNAHWVVLDSNPYADWRSGKRAEWLEADLKAAAKAKWRFVAFHHPPFHSGRAHAGEQHMRYLAPVFEKYKVDVVFNGHVHNYQRSYPLRFTPAANQGFNLFGSSEVHGEFLLDKSFDGEKDTTPVGTIYIVSGCGGAPLNQEKSLENPEKRDAFTAKYAAVHSYTRCEIRGGQLSLRQVACDGTELDHVVITKQ